MSDIITTGKIHFLTGINEADMPALSQNTIGNVYFLMNPDLNRGKIIYDYCVNGTLNRAVMSSHVYFADEAAYAWNADQATLADLANKAELLVEDGPLNLLNVGSETKPVYVEDGKVTECGNTLNVNITGSASSFTNDATISLTGDVTGSASGKNAWTINTTIPTNSIENNQLLHSKVTIAGNDIELGSVLTAIQLRASLGLTNALRFVGKATVTITEGSTTNPQIVGYDFSNVAIGDVILDLNADKEFFWNNAWETLGAEGSYKILQTAVTDPTSSGSAIDFISSISQNENGEITATKAAVRSATVSQSGVVSTSEQSFGGKKIFNNGVDIKSTGNAVLHTEGVSSSTDYINIFVDGSNNNTRPIILQNGYGNIGIGNIIAPTEKVEVNGNVKANTFKGALEGNASSATKLATARKINGTNFDGSADITTDKWGAQRTVSISGTAGVTGTNVDGSGNVSLILPRLLSNFTKITSAEFEGDLTGNADSANKLNTNAGGTNRPVYFSNGVPVAVEQSAVLASEHNAIYNNGTSKLAIGIGTDNQKGLYDETKSKWIVYSDTNGNITLNGNALSANKINTNAGSTSQPVYFANGVPVAITGTISNTAASANKLNTNAGNASQPVYFANGVPVAITGTIGNNAATASKVNHVLTFGNKTYDGSAQMEITAADLHIIDAMSFMGSTNDDITTTYKNNPIITIKGTGQTATAQSGSIVIYNKNQYYWNTYVTPNEWTYIDMGDGTSYKIVQDAKPSPTASGNDISFIDTVSQDTNGNITATRKTVRDASASQSGVVTTGAQTFAGVKTFNNNINANGGITVTGDILMPTASSSIYWNDATYRQRIKTTDDSAANTAVFSFQQSSDSGSSFTDLMTIKDNGEIVATKFTGALNGNANTATKLATARTLTIGSTGKTFDGSANVSWTLAEIGAQAAGSYKTTQTAVSDPSSSGSSTTFIASISQNTNGVITVSKKGLDTSGTWTGTASNASKVANKFIIKANTGTTEGTNLYTFDGSAAKTLDIKSGTGLSLLTAAGTITINHSNSVTAGTAQGSATGTLSFGGTFTIPTVTYDAQGHITGTGTTTMTMPANPNTDTKNTAGSTNKTATKLFLIGAETQAANPQTYSNSAVYISTGNVLMGAAWNDFAEYRKSDITEAGRVIVENGDDSLSLSSQRMQPGAEVVSDTFGFAIGQTEECQTPIAAAGRVLAYGYEDREEFKKNIGRPVCSGPNGTVSIMTDEEYKEKGYCAIGFISAVPEYEEWGQNNIKVNNRIWIRIK